MSDELDLLECSQFVEQKYPDDIGEWPEMYRLSAYAARDRVLQREPDLSVIAERSYCVDSTSERWPKEGVPAGCTHAIMFEVRLNRPLAEPLV